MTLNEWTAVDNYIVDSLLGTDSTLESIRQASEAAGLPPISVSPNQGKLLFLLAQLHGARTILEIGTLAGYSTTWLARALPSDGRLITLELEPRYAEIARANFVSAGFDDLVEVRVGKAIDSLRQLAEEGSAPFDMLFIDADKEQLPAYLEWSIKLTRPGGLIIVDNVIRDGQVVDKNSEDLAVQGVRRFYTRLAGDHRVEATAIQTVGSKGYDGFALLRVAADS